MNKYNKKQNMTKPLKKSRCWGRQWTLLGLVKKKHLNWVMSYAVLCTEISTSRVWDKYYREKAFRKSSNNLTNITTNMFWVFILCQALFWTCHMYWFICFLQRHRVDTINILILQRKKLRNRGKMNDSSSLSK